MDRQYVLDILKEVASGSVNAEEAADILKDLPYEEIGDFVKIDNHRSLRTGQSEVVFCQGKTSEQIASIMAKLWETSSVVMGTRATEDNYKAVKALVPQAKYNERARVITIKKDNNKINDKIIAVVTAGTADIPAAEEAAVTAEALGNNVCRIFDVGVAGIHRLFANLDEIRKANVIIVAAGMEGALASVVGGLVDKPVIALPTSVGYGSGAGGTAALLSMLNSCANGIAVVNIDNGFGAGYMAATINRL